jgi:octanoyl-[GcvH]:protein N-octanoyltransferase
VTRLLVHGHPEGGVRSAVSDLLVPAVLLRAARTDWSELVHVYPAHGPTVAFSSRDLRSQGLLRATAIARDAGFETVVRSPGGRMVAYDEGAVVIDHLTRSSDLRQAGASAFALNAESHVDVLRSLGDLDARVGEVPGEYCPGEYSVNIGGHAKVIGSAQRITGTGALFSTVVQVVVPDEVHDVIVAVSAALGYELRESSIAGLADFSPGLTSDRVAAALVADYRRRLALTDSELAPDLIAHATAATAVARTEAPFDVDTWTRAHPFRSA